MVLQSVPGKEKLAVPWFVLGCSLAVAWPEVARGLEVSLIQVQLVRTPAAGQRGGHMVHSGWTLAQIQTPTELELKKTAMDSDSNSRIVHRVAEWTLAPTQAG